MIHRRGCRRSTRARAGGPWSSGAPSGQAPPRRRSGSNAPGPRRRSPRPSRCGRCEGRASCRRSPPSRTAPAHSRSASARTRRRSCPGAPSGARKTGCSRKPSRPGPRPRRGTPSRAGGALHGPGAAAAWLEARRAQRPSPAAHIRSLLPPAGIAAHVACHRRDRTAAARTGPPPTHAPERSIPSPRSRSPLPRSAPGQAQIVTVTKDVPYAHGVDPLHQDPASSSRSMDRRG